jgi:hypothetical protein
MRAALRNPAEAARQYVSTMKMNPPPPPNVTPPPRRPRRRFRFVAILALAILALSAGGYLYFFGGPANSSKGNAAPNNVNVFAPPPATPQPSPPVIQTTPATLNTPAVPSPSTDASASPETTPTPPSPSPTAASTPPVQSAKAKVESQFFTFDLKQCRLSGASVACDLLITNNERDRRLTIRKSSTIFDQDGNQYHAGKLQLANNEDDYSVNSYMITGVTTKARVVFDAVSTSANRLTLLHLNLSVEDGPDFNIEYRNVPLR